MFIGFSFFGFGFWPSLRLPTEGRTEGRRLASLNLERRRSVIDRTQCVVLRLSHADLSNCPRAQRVAFREVTSHIIPDPDDTFIVNLDFVDLGSFAAEGLASELNRFHIRLSFSPGLLAPSMSKPCQSFT